MPPSVNNEIVVKRNDWRTQLHAQSASVTYDNKFYFIKFELQKCYIIKHYELLKNIFWFFLVDFAEPRIDIKVKVTIASLSLYV